MPHPRERSPRTTGVRPVTVATVSLLFIVVGFGGWWLVGLNDQLVGVDRRGTDNPVVDSPSHDSVEGGERGAAQRPDSVEPAAQASGQLDAEASTQGADAAPAALDPAKTHRLSIHIPIVGGLPEPEVDPYSRDERTCARPSAPGAVSPGSPQPVAATGQLPDH
jgi:hypothetical protein